jgi:hypothetical protein
MERDEEVRQLTIVLQTKILGRLQQLGKTSEQVQRVLLVSHIMESFVGTKGVPFNGSRPQRIPHETRISGRVA